MSHEDLINLLDYHYWARDRILDALLPLPAEQFTHSMNSSFKSVRDTVAHMFAAELVWYSRWCGDSPKGLVSGDRFPDVASLRSAWSDLERDVRAFVNKLGPEGMSRRFEYARLNGQPESSAFSRMLHQIVNHGSYHRGQVTTMLRQIGVAPPKSMDLITFYREQEAQGAETRTA